MSITRKVPFKTGDMYVATQRNKQYSRKCYLILGQNKDEQDLWDMLIIENGCVRYLEKVPNWALNEAWWVRI
jgi:hypothetical protein